MAQMELSYLLGLTAAAGGLFSWLAQKYRKASVLFGFMFFLSSFLICRALLVHGYALAGHLAAFFLPAYSVGFIGFQAISQKEKRKNAIAVLLLLAAAGIARYSLPSHCLMVQHLSMALEEAKLAYSLSSLLQFSLFLFALVAFAVVPLLAGRQLVSVHACWFLLCLAVTFALAGLGEAIFGVGKLLSHGSELGVAVVGVQVIGTTLLLNGVATATCLSLLGALELINSRQTS